MAEVFGPFGLCFGALSFILSTTPTVVETAQTWLESNEHFQIYNFRHASCESNYRKG
ncbi:uncharacterized protein BDR25DRAFT_305719 [Lindgomyces ingoldianus]|uniref:Uncharacterized protein n=1 Tax=Lindgomyces ingoldianus TaxID=673940 RepID=A0ACB6QKD5_9PLEO|nr:uncharacterized protein BDR25DRAFT_305719 [Lindgomyces ingoldianus]KAF2467327.1 hypothetical protein BDR25DRAFT_305719 [Lindgomyces ingoldianus]